MRNGAMSFAVLACQLLVSVNAYSQSDPLGLGKEFSGFKYFSHPTHVLQPGVIYTVDRKSQSTFVVLDVARGLSPTEQSRMIERTTSVPLTSNSKASRSLVATLLEYVGLNHETAKTASAKATLHIESVFLETLVKSAFLQKLSQTDFIVRNPDLENFYVIVGTINVGAIQFEFADEASARLVRTALDAGASPAGVTGQLSWKSQNTLSLSYDGELAIAFKAARFPVPGSLSPGFRPAAFKFMENGSGAKPQSKRTQKPSPNLVATSDFPDPTADPPTSPAVPTHEKADFNPIANPQNKTYGDLLSQIESVLQNAGIGEHRVIPLGSGFGVVTALEVLEDDGGKPLASTARFYIGGDYKDRRQGRGESQISLAIKSFVERRRAYVIGVDGRALPSINSIDPEKLFRLDYGGIDIPDRLKGARVDPGTRIRVFVYEFSKHNNEPSRLLSYGDCGQKIEDHLIQDGVSKH